MTDSCCTLGGVTTGKDFLITPLQNVYHLGINANDVTSRILTVGCHKRAAQIALALDKTPKPFTKITSERLFTTITGTYKGVPVSIIAIGMGVPMVDIMMREFSYLRPGPMAIIRLGSSGLLNERDRPGTVIVADPGTSYIYTNYAYFHGSSNDPQQDGRKSGAKPYIVTKPINTDKDLTESLYKYLKAQNIDVERGPNCSAETFFACEGRIDERFEDENRSVQEELKKQNFRSLEMETHQILHQASLRRSGRCYAASCTIGVLNRVHPEMSQNITDEKIAEVQEKAGIACLEALKDIELPAN